MTYVTHTEAGRRYEEIAVEVLRRQGFTVTHLSAEQYHDSDLRLDPDLLVEVKGSREVRINKFARGYKFVLAKEGTNLAPTESAIVLVCLTATGEPELFIIPRELADTPRIHITSANPRKYKGRWAIYRDAYTLLDELGAKRKRPN